MSPLRRRVPAATLIATVALTAAAAAPNAAAAHARAKPKDPLAAKAIHRYLEHRRGSVSIAVEDLDVPAPRRSRGKRKHRHTKTITEEWRLHPGRRFQTASIVKADILETLLHHHGGPLNGDISADATGMIEDSDNTDATELWNTVGGAKGVAAYNKQAGLTQTVPNAAGYWGETMTSAADQLKLLCQLAEPSKVLTKAERRYQLSLMDNIDAGENWGVTGGVPKGVRVALKNGWVPLKNDYDWEINSIGWVHGDHHDYVIAVLTAHDPSEQYGIDTIDKLSSMIYKRLRT